MRDNITKIIGMVLLIVMSMLCQSCESALCEAERQKCLLDCPKTMIIKQACEQKCNVQYDICKNKK
jgi:hypothetical protein